MTMAGRCHSANSSYRHHTIRSSSDGRCASPAPGPGPITPLSMCGVMGPLQPGLSSTLVWESHWQVQLGIAGKAVNIVYTEAMRVALNLGYRCLELDVWRVSSAPFLVVRHGPTNVLSNSISLEGALAAIVAWMQDDEETDGISGVGRVRLPLILSIENKVATETGETEMAAAFSAAFGERLVSAEQACAADPQHGCDRSPPWSPRIGVLAQLMRPHASLSWLPDTRLS